MTLENRTAQRDDVAPAHPVSGVNRRSVIVNSIVSVASVASATAISAASASNPNQDTDTEVRRLWSDYQQVAAAVIAAQKEHRPHRRRANEALDRIERGLPWDEHCARVDATTHDPEFRRTQDAVTFAWEQQRPLVAAIHTHRATTLFAIGAKLAALPTAPIAGRYDIEDFKDAAIAVMRDIDALLGTEFARPYEDLYTSCLTGVDADEDEGDEDESDDVDEVEADGQI